jgi:spoIIIJ-associated protein
MYDAMNEAHEFVASTRDEALRKASDFFSVGVDELQIGEFPEGEVYGLAGRSVIVASLRNRRSPSPSRPAGRESGRPSGRESGREKGGRGERRPRGGRGSERREASDRGSDRAPARASEEPTEPSVGTARGELGEIGAFLLGVMERMDVGPFEISESGEDDLLVFEVRGSAARALASGEGRTVDALQLLANQVVKTRDMGSTRIVVDVEGSADARGEFLADLAARAASRGRKTSRAVALDPMNARDRRTIHMALHDEQGVATMSVGEGRYRQVVIVPEGAPEYEQALRESEEARHGNER